MSPFWTILSIVLILVLFPALLRLMDEPIDWSRWSIPHRIAALIRRTRNRRQPAGHQHVWHHIAACRDCGAVVHETSTP